MTNNCGGEPMVLCMAFRRWEQTNKQTNKQKVYRNIESTYFAEVCPQCWSILQWDEKIMIRDTTVVGFSNNCCCATLQRA